MHGQLVSELKGIGGCHFLANREGLIWSEEAGGELGGDRFTIKTSNPFYVSSFFFSFTSELKQINLFIY